MRLSKIVTVLSAATAGIIVVPGVLGGTYTFQNGASNDFVDSYAGTRSAQLIVITGNSNSNTNYGGVTSMQTRASSSNRYRIILGWDLSSLTPYASELTVTGASMVLTQSLQGANANTYPLVVNLFNSLNAGWLQGTGTSAATTTGPWATGADLAAATGSTAAVPWENTNGSSAGILLNSGSSTGPYSVLFSQPNQTGDYLETNPTGTHYTVTDSANSKFTTAVQSWISTPSQNGGLYIAPNVGSSDSVEYYSDNTTVSLANRPALQITLTSATSSSDYTNAGSDMNWSDTSDWDNGSPNTIGATANFGSAITTPTTVTVDSPQTVSAINFDNSNSYTIGGSSTITLLEVNTGQATISVASGNHTISAPISVRTDTTFNVASGSTLAVTGTFSAANKTITNTGAGTVQLPALIANTLNISAGTVQIAQQPNSGNPAGTSVLSTLSLSGGTLDLTNNGLVIPFTGTNSPINTIASAIAAGSITSSTTNPGHPTGIGYADALTIGAIGSFLGQSFSTDAVVMRYTLMGDTNLDGSVDSNDFDTLATNYGMTVTAGWDLGDFNGDGIVNALDFNALATNYGAPLDPPVDAVALGALVPEPTTIGLICGVAALLTTRRRRGSQLRIRHDC